MGCDIHLFKEKHIDGKWLTADEWVEYDYGDGDKGIEVHFEKRAFTGRNYHLFGLLAHGVRAEHPFSFYPRCLPFNPCKEVAEVAAGYGCDGHNHSYLYLHELKEIATHLETTTIRISGMKDKEGLAKLLASVASDTPDWNLLWPYCGWSSRSDYEEFEIDVPASFYMGQDLKKIIDSFDWVDGDNHRIVFFFDN